MKHGLMNHEIAARCERIAESLVEGLSEAIDDFFTNDVAYNNSVQELLTNPMRLDIEDCDEDSDFNESLRMLIEARAMKILTSSAPIASDDIEDMI